MEMDGKKHELPKQYIEEGKMINSPTYIKNVQDDDVRGGRAQLIGCFHPNLIRCEEGEVARDVAGVALLCRAVTNTFFLRAVPPAHRNKEDSHCTDGSSMNAEADHLTNRRSVALTSACT